MMKRRRSHLGVYLLINILVSAATTLGVLYAWDTLQPSQLPEGARSILAAEQATRAVLSTSGGNAWQPAPSPTVKILKNQTPLPMDTVIEVGAVVGAGDLTLEYVLLRRVGEGDLNLAGWALQNSGGEYYTFPDLILYKGGAVQVFSRAGSDTATTLFWNRTAPAWKPGDSVTLLDAQGNIRASYTAP